MRGYKTEVTEFDYKGVNEIVYQKNGVTIRSFPAVHSLDGSVSYSLEWNGLKFVYGSDTYPNKWFIEYARNADLAIHECFIAVPDLVSKMRFTPEQALQVGTQVHTAPEAFGKVMSEVKPRMAAVEEATWAPPGVQTPLPPSDADRDAFSERLGWQLPFSEFVARGQGLCLLEDRLHAAKRGEKSPGRLGIALS